MTLKPEDKIVMVYGATLPAPNLAFTGKVEIVARDPDAPNYDASDHPEGMWFDQLPVAFRDDVFPRASSFRVGGNVLIGTIDEIMEHLRAGITKAAERTMDETGPMRSNNRKNQDRVNEVYTEPGCLVLPTARAGPALERFTEEVKKHEERAK